MAQRIAVFLLCGAAAAASPAYPDRPGKKVVEKTCGGCHGLRLMENMRKTRDGWRTSVDSMLAKGMKAEDEEIDIVVDYLSRYLSRLNVNQASAADLADVLDITAQQAEAIANYRKENGKIKNFDELEKVPGLDPRKLADHRTRLAF